MQNFAAIFGLVPHDPISIALEFESATGDSSENWDALVLWVEKSKGAKSLADFLDRTSRPV